MSYKHITVNCKEPEEGQAELNSFIASHRVIKVSSQLMDLGVDSYWAYQVEYSDSGAFTNGGKGESRPRVDYKEKLSPEDFTVYLGLRDLRKEIADEEGVPVFSVFTNAQLAEMAEKSPKTVTELGEINGVGDSRKKKYGERFINRLQGT